MKLGIKRRDAENAEIRQDLFLLLCDPLRSLPLCVKRNLL